MVQRKLAITAAGLSLVAVCYGLARFAYGLFVPALREEFHLDGATAGVIASASYAGYCVAIVVASLATQRWGARPVAVAAGIAATAGTALIASAPTAALLAVGVVVGGSSTGLASPPLADAVAKWVPAHRADRIQAVVNSGTGAGVLVSGPVALLADDSWRAAWWAFAAIAAAVTVWIAFAVPGGPAAVTPGSRTRVLPPGAPRLLIAATALGVSSAAVWTFGRDVLVTEGGASALTSTLVWIVLGAAGILGGLAGDLATKLGTGRAWTATMVALGAATATLALAADHVVVTVPAGAVFGASYIALTGLALLWATRVYAERPAFGVGAAFLLVAVGQAAGAPLIGLLSDTYGPVTAFLVATAVALAGGLVRPARTSRPDAATTADPAPRPG
ncbi:MFS transporter [Amycolatopsis suaedae]|uniref:MFS transporter n=1 Tax=Amycolatopsis suaedae TaxID=2510978 RepID=UPI001F0DBB71|nr:MFS transporter [Amycolatopsis suaedae]